MQGVAIDRKLTHTASVTATGVTSQHSVPFNAVIMMVTSALYLTIQVPAWLGNSHPHIPALVGAILCMVTLAAYCAYQVRPFKKTVYASQLWLTAGDKVRLACAAAVAPCL